MRPHRRGECRSLFLAVPQRLVDRLDGPARPGPYDPEDLALRLFIALLFGLLMAALAFGFCAFVAWDINIGNWTSGGRFGVAVLMLWAGGSAFGLYRTVLDPES